MKERFGIHSIFVKQLICFALGNAIIVLVMTAIFLNAFQLAREEVYDRMNAQSEYYLETLDAQLENIYNLEINFFYDRRLVFLMEERSSLSDYERRDALLSLEERLQAIQGCSNLIQNIYLFIPNTNYMITPSSAGRMQNEEDWALLMIICRTMSQGFISMRTACIFWKRTGIASARRITLPIL